MTIAFDCSNYTGPLLPATLTELDNWGVTHGMFGTQDAKICEAQVEAWFEYGQDYKRVLTEDLYIQFDANQRAYAQVSRAADVYGYEAIIGDVYIAVEQAAVPWLGTVAEYLSRLDEAFAVAVGLGIPDAKLGIYTSPSQWSALTGNSMLAKYAKRKLWYATYDHAQSLSPDFWRAQGFGPWWTPTWKQYEAGSDNLGYLLPSGQKVDFSVSV